MLRSIHWNEFAVIQLYLGIQPHWSVFWVGWGFLVVWFFLTHKKKPKPKPINKKKTPTKTNAFPSPPTPKNTQQLQQNPWSNCQTSAQAFGVCCKFEFRGYLCFWSVSFKIHRIQSDRSKNSCSDVVWVWLFFLWFFFIYIFWKVDHGCINY